MGVGRPVAVAAAAKVNSHYGDNETWRTTESKIKNERKNKVVSTDRLSHVARLLPSSLLFDNIRTSDSGGDAATGTGRIDVDSGICGHILRRQSSSI